MYIAGELAIGWESRNVYCWCAHYRIEVQECILLVHPLQNASLGMYITCVPAVGCKSRNVYYWCAPCRMQVQECILLLRPLQNVSPRMYITGALAVECESRNVYCWCARCRMGVLECILLVRPLQNITGALAVGCESRNVYYWYAHCRIQVQGCISLMRPLQDASLGMYVSGSLAIECEIICLTQTYISCLGKSISSSALPFKLMGLPLMYEFLAVLQNMSRRASSRGDWGMAPIYVTSYKDDSSDNETASTSEQVA